MILLLGGTSETAEISTALADAGWPVLVSTATDVELNVGDHPDVTRRVGPLDAEAMGRLVAEMGVKAIVDATHPYAAQAHATTARVAKEAGIPCLRWQRPGAAMEESVVSFADDHEQAAVLAASFGKPVLLTIGSTNLAPYVREALQAGVLLVARILDRPESVAAALAAGVPEQRIIQGRGPFSAEENIALIREYAVKVIVTKDSGEAGGVPAKIQAARSERCWVIVVRRPDEAGCAAYNDVASLVHAARRALQNSKLHIDGERAPLDR